MSLPQLCIFDLDGVIVDTARFHYRAWKKTAGRFGYALTPAQNEALKGVSRRDSLACILKWAGITLQKDEFDTYCDEKNDMYLHFIKDISPEDALDGVVPFIRQLKEKGVKIALGSASKNARTIIEKLGILPLFDYIVDGTMTTRGKPHPEVFLLSSNHLDTSPSSAVVFEDAVKGLQAAKKAGMFCIGIGKASELPFADIVWPDFGDKTAEDLSRCWIKPLTV